MSSEKEIERQIKICEDTIKQANEMHEHLKPKTTKFEITMTLEVVDVGGVPANVSVLSDAVKEAIESISSGDVVKITEIATGTHTSRKS